MSDALETLKRGLSGQGEDFVSRWLAAATVRSWRLRGEQRLRPQLEERASAFLVALQRSIEGAESLALGSPIFKEPIALLSFFGGWMAGVGLPAGAAVALCHALEDVVGPGAQRFFESLVVVVAEAHAAGVVQSAQANHRQVIEKSQVVVMLSRRIAGLFLVGDPDREALDDAVGRLMMLAFQREARAVIVDASGLLDRAVLPTAVGFLAEHREALATRRIALAAVSSAEAAELAAGARLPIDGFERLEDALGALSASSDD